MRYFALLISISTFAIPPTTTTTICRTYGTTSQPDLIKGRVYITRTSGCFGSESSATVETESGSILGGRCHWSESGGGLSEVCGKIEIRYAEGSKNNEVPTLSINGGTPQPIRCQRSGL